MHHGARFGDCYRAARGSRATGDFNDTEESPFLKPLLRAKHLVDVIAQTRPADDRWTYYWRSEGRGQQIDVILGSRALATRVRRSHFERAELAYGALRRHMWTADAPYKHRTTHHGGVRLLAKGRSAVWLLVWLTGLLEASKQAWARWIATDSPSTTPSPAHAPLVLLFTRRMPFDPNAPTEEKVVLPWATDSAGPPPVVPHLVIAWLLDEPDRVGQAARLDCPCWLGRGGVTHDGEPEPLEFVEQRPGQSLAAAPMANTTISRRQLLFFPEEGGRVRVQCVGRRELLHNGQLTSECVATAGDTLMLQSTAVFVVEERAVELPALRHYGAPDFPFGSADAQGLVGETPAAWRLRDALAEAAASRAHVLLQGESGAGKELAARVIHERSSRAAKAFVARNAATIPAALIDAELFGTARNYPNAGRRNGKGSLVWPTAGRSCWTRSESCPKSTRRICSASSTGGEYHRLGESVPRRSDFRLVAATNRGLDRLKPDFAARFGYRIAVPPLGERRGDIALLMRGLLDQIAAEGGTVREQFFAGPTGKDVRIDPGLVERLLRHEYTHRTRQLERLLRLAISSSAGDFLALTSELESELETNVETLPPPARLADAREVSEAERAAAALRTSGGRIGQAAADLGITRHAMRRLMKKYGLTAD